MSSEFRSLREILHETRTAEVAPVISPLIAEVMPAEPTPEIIAQEPESENRILQARVLDRFESVLRRLLDEIAAEVLGRELLLAPAEIERIVLRLKKRFGFNEGMVQNARGDITIDVDGAEVDASLGRRLHSALERALA